MRLETDPSLFHFSADVRVRWADTDAVGIAYNGAYLTWFEVARVEYFRASMAWKLGCSIDDPRVQDTLFQERGAVFTLAASTLNWRLPARVDQRLRAATRISRIGSTSMDHQLHLTRPSDGAVIALGESTQVRVHPQTLQPMPLDPAMIQDLQGFDAALRSGKAHFPPRMA